MPKRKGVVDNFTSAYQKIGNAISSMNGRCFTAEEIHEITGVNREDIRTFLSEKTKKEFLERLIHTCYRKVSPRNLTHKLPNAFIATKVWRVLCQSDRPLILREISEIIEKETGFYLYKQISFLLIMWCRRNTLDKLGTKRPYAFQIKPEYKGKDRPVSSSPF